MINWLGKHNVLNQAAEYRLLSLAKRGNKEAFGKLYLNYLDRIYRYIFFRVVRDRVVAEDLTQTVFLKAWEKIDSFDVRRGQFRTWLYRIAHNTVVDYYRSDRGHLYLADDLVHHDATLEMIDFREDCRRVMEAFTHLTEEQSMIITLKFIEGLSNEEISNVTGKREDAVRSLQYRGLHALREILNHE